MTMCAQNCDPLGRAWRKTLLALFLNISIMPTLARADVYSYDCVLHLPPQAGWTTIGEFCEPDQWIDDGWLVQHTEWCPDTPAGQQFDYTRSLAEFDGETQFYIEWRLVTDGDRSEVCWSTDFCAGRDGP